MDVAELRALPLFDGTADDQLRSLVAEGREVAFAPREELFRAGRPADSWWVLLDGRIDLLRHVGREETVVGAMEAPGTWVGAIGAWDEGAVYLATGRARTSGRALRIPGSGLRKVTSAAFPLGDHLVGGVITSLRRVESMVRDKEALIGLGTLAAGLAHELNNPAAAVARAVDALGADWEAVLPTMERLAAGSVPAGRFSDLDVLRRELERERPAVDPLAAGELEDQVSGCLSEHGVQRPWRLAPVLARSGADVAWCDRAAEVLGDALEPGLEWVVRTVTATRSLQEAKDAAARISGLVAAVKSYSQLDRASVQPVDIAEGLESTLAVMAHRIPPGVTVVRDLAGGVPQVQAAAAELNQVWTHLIANALDAMGDDGTLSVVARAADAGGVVVEIGDTGPGMSPEVRQHAFDPFFTTKGVGRGTGLGLDVARRIVERHGGEIGIDTSPGGTVLRVRLRPDVP